MGTSGLTIFRCLSQMFQCARCGVSQSRAEEVVQHFLREHLKPSEVPFMCDQCQFRAQTWPVMMDHRRGKHQVPEGEDLDQICYETLRPIREEEIFKLLLVLHRPGAEGKKEERSKGGGRTGSHGWAFHEERYSGHRGKRSSQEPLPKCSSLVRELSPKRRKQNLAVPPENADGEMVRTYLQRLCNGDPQKLADLAGMNHEATTDDLQEPAEMSLTDAIIEGTEQPRPETAQDADPLPVKEAAVVPVDVSTPEEVAPEGNPAAEEPRMPVKLPKVPRPVAPYKYAAAQQYHRPLPSPLHGLSIIARGSLRQTGSAGKTSTQDCKLTLKLHTQLGAMTRELHRVHKLQQEQLTLQGQQLELQWKESVLREWELQAKEAVLKVLWP